MIQTLNIASFGSWVCWVSAWSLFLWTFDYDRSSPLLSRSLYLEYTFFGPRSYRHLDITMQYRQVAEIKLAKIKLQPSIPKWRTYEDTKIRYRELFCPNDVWSYVEGKFTFKYNVNNVVLRKERKSNCWRTRRRVIPSFKVVNEVWMNSAN